MPPMTEEARLDALYQLKLLDTPPSESFDRITRMASQIFDLPIAAVSLTDRDRQWFKSRVGVEHTQIPRIKAPCGEVADSTGFVLVPDLLTDPCYANSVLAAQGVRFYAGAPLVTRDGYGLGALCVLGREPRTITEAEKSSLTDLAQMVMSQIELQHAFGRIEPLSGFPNRTQFLEDLEDLGRDQPDERRLMVLIDLARTEELDEGARVMGSSYVDDIVQEAARTIRALLGARTAYHIAATQFAFLALPEADPVTYLAMLEKHLQRAREKSNVRFAMTTAIGVAPFKAGECSARDILRTAYSACYDARTTKTSVSVYSASADEAHQRRFRLLNDFSEALDQHGALRLVYQPRVDLSTGRCCGAEALLRWNHPLLGEVSPGEFIPIIEQTSLARSATAWVLNAALKQLSSWHRAELDIRLSVNVSAANLEESDFAQSVQLFLLKHRVRPEMLELEVTETAVMKNADQALSQLTALSAAGVRLAIDDFGTGYSSLAYLQRLPAQVVKIDQSFILGLEGDKRERTLVRSMITLSHALGYRVVAEGVETAAAADILTEMNCDEAQGYFFARPVEAACFDRWYASAGAQHSLAAA